MKTWTTIFPFLWMYIHSCCPSYFKTFQNDLNYVSALDIPEDKKFYNLGLKQTLVMKLFINDCYS